MDNLERRLKLGDAVRKARLSRGLSDRDLAAAMGSSSHSYINNVENGVNSVGFDKLCEIADALGYDVSYFFIDF